jgi:hypothetical protein
MSGWNDAINKHCKNKKARKRGLFLILGWLMGFEPTTTGITIQDSTAELQPPLMRVGTDYSLKL